LATSYHLRPVDLYHSEKLGYLTNITLSHLANLLNFDPVIFPALIEFFDFFFRIIKKAVLVYPLEVVLCTVKKAQASALSIILLHILDLRCLEDIILYKLDFIGCELFWHNG